MKKASASIGSIRKLLLIAGIPGMGKTTIGNFLEKHRDYLHVDMEMGGRIHNATINPAEFVSDLLKKEKSIVVTWGFVPCPELIDIMNLLRSHDFKLIWFDGDRNVARNVFIGRGKISVDLFDSQVRRINESKVTERISPIFIDTFDESGNFRKKADIANEIESA